MYIIYWTVYYGQKMPRNYIGHTTLEKHQKGYLGSVSSAKYREIWKLEIRCNPQLFKSYIIEYVKGNRNDAIIREEWWHRRYQVAINPFFINMCCAKLGFYMDDSVIEKITQTHRSKTINEIRAATAKQLQTKNNKSPEEKQARIEKLRIQTTLQWANLTTEERKRRSELTMLQNQNRHPEVNNKISNTIKNIMDARTEEEWAIITEKKRKTWENRRLNGIRKKQPEKLLCDCGKLISPSNFSRHKIKCSQVSSEHPPPT